MAPSSIGCPKVQMFKHAAKGRRNKDIESSTRIPPHAKELPLRTSLVRDSVKKQIFAYMDKGDRSADIELKSGLSHLRVKRYRRLWKDERHDPRLRSKKRLRRKGPSRVPSCEPVQLPLRLKSACDQKLDQLRVTDERATDKGKRKHRAARGLKECEVNPKREDAGPRVQEASSMQMKPPDFPPGTECQLVIRLTERPTQ